MGGWSIFGGETALGSAADGADASAAAYAASVRARFDDAGPSSPSSLLRIIQASKTPCLMLPIAVNGSIVLYVCVLCTLQKIDLLFPHLQKR
jgi:hypothetical protein